RRSAVAHREGHLRHLPRLRRRDRRRAPERDSVDAGVHHLQGKTKRVKPADLIELLKSVYRDKSAMKARHIAAAKLVADYDFNNTYQYVINREEILLQWLRDAIEDRGATVEDAAEPQIQGAGTAKKAQLQVIKTDADSAQAFVERWKDKV